MISLKTSEEIHKLELGGRILAETLADLENFIKAGITTWDLELLARELIEKRGGQPAFLNFKPAGSFLPFPTALCISINDEIVHGVPSPQRIIKEGDIVSLDLGLIYQGLITDMATTIIIDNPQSEHKKLLEITKESLLAGISGAQPNKRIGNIGFEVSQVIEGGGFKVIEGLAGHGVGHQVHEEPLIPNKAKRTFGPVIVPGMVLAIEPMATSGSGQIKQIDDFTFSTKDGTISAHFELTVAITTDGPKIITSF